MNIQLSTLQSVCIGFGSDYKTHLRILVDGKRFYSLIDSMNMKSLLEKFIDCYKA